MSAAHRTFVVWMAGVAVFLAATNLYVNPIDDYARYAEGFNDSFSYMAMAEAAPGVPTTRVPFHHAQRIAIPYLLGVAHDATRMPTHVLFLIAVVAFGVGTLMVLRSTLERVGSPAPLAAVLVAVFILNPWTFRPYIAYPELVDDLGFVFGLSLVTMGLVHGRMGQLLVGQLAASLSRQTGILLLPMIVIALWASEPGRTIEKRTRQLTAAAVGTVAIAIYLITSRVALQFGQPNMNTEHLVGAIHWAQSSFNARQLAAFLVAAAEAPFLLVTILGTTLLIARRRPSVIVTSLLVGSLCIWAQPLLAGPQITGGNIQRLITLGLVPLVIATALELRNAGVAAITMTARSALVATVLLALASLHHHYVAPWLPFFRTNALSIGLFAAGNLVSAALIAHALRRTLVTRASGIDTVSIDQLPATSDRMA